MSNTAADKPTVSRLALAIELMILSFTALYFELLVIRWLGCDFKSFMVFNSFPLVTCFVGLGIGVAQSDDRLFARAPFALLLCAGVIAFTAAVGLRETPFPAIGVYQWFNVNVLAGANWAMIVGILSASILALLVGPFFYCICVGSRIGQLFNQLQPLEAYCVDIAGAIAGSLVFALSSFLCLNPAVQLACVAIVTMFALWNQKQLRPLQMTTAVVATILSFYAVAPRTGTSVWSPYQRVDVTERRIDRKHLKGNPQQDLLWVNVQANHSFMQYFTPFPEAEISQSALTDPELKSIDDKLFNRRNYYNLPYRAAHPETVLVLGAGTGSDVWMAIKNGAKQVDAVEIDPYIVEQGRRINPLYSDPRVHVVCNDARNYVDHCQKKYDMVVFGCLDSLANVGMSSMRTDSHIHTVESYKRCLSLLKPQGLFVLSFGASQSGNGWWLGEKFRDTLARATGYQPLVMTDQSAPKHWPAYVFFTGEPVRLGQLTTISDPVFSVLKDVKDEPSARVVTDDWPYLYIRPVGVDLPYAFVLCLVVDIAVFASRRLLMAKTNTGKEWQLFFLGAAFMLLELQSIARLSLLYGNTWLTASIVINGILIMILCANFVIYKIGKSRKQWTFYIGLLLALLTDWLLPIPQMLGLDATFPYAGTICVTLLTVFPMFMAGLIFATAFANTKTPARSFSFNLLGSVAGALLANASVIIGINTLVDVAIVIYAVSYWCHALTLGTDSPVSS
jgi:hypothetical protein